MKLQCMQYESPIKKWLRIFSPCVVLILLAVIGLVYCVTHNSYGSAGGIIFFAGMVAGALLTDVVIKQFIKSIRMLYAVEVLMMLFMAISIRFVVMAILN